MRVKIPISVKYNKFWRLNELTYANYMNDRHNQQLRYLWKAHSRLRSRKITIKSALKYWFWGRRYSKYRKSSFMFRLIVNEVQYLDFFIWVKSVEIGINRSSNIDKKIILIKKIWRPPPAPLSEKWPWKQEKCVFVKNESTHSL